MENVTLNAILSAPDGSVYVADTTSISRIFDSRLSYHKGAYVLHMLRWLMGDQAFFSALRNYLNDPELKYRFATFEDVKLTLKNKRDQPRFLFLINGTMAKAILCTALIS